jgi:hypothetical protein
MESPRHKELKEYVANHFSQSGWRVEPEASGSGWRADVLVNNGQGRQAAIEIELSNPSVKSMTARQARYQRSGLPVIWIIGHQPRGGKTSIDLPFFVLKDPGNNQCSEPEVLIDYHFRPLPLLLQGLIDGRLHWRRSILDPQRCGYLITFDAQCWSCQQDFTAIRGLQIPTCYCGRELETADDLNQAVFEAAFRRGLQEGTIAPLNGPVAKMYFRKTHLAPEPYWANHCPHCQQVQGDFYLQLPAMSVYHYRQGGSCQPVYTPSAVFTDWQQKFSQQYLASREIKHWCLVPEKADSAVKRSRPFLDHQQSGSRA